MELIEPIRHIVCGTALIWRQTPTGRNVAAKDGRTEPETALQPWCDVCRRPVPRNEFNKPTAKVCAA